MNERLSTALTITCFALIVLITGIYVTVAAMWCMKRTRKSTRLDFAAWSGDGFLGFHPKTYVVTDTLTGTKYTYRLTEYSVRKDAVILVEKLATQ